jgi:TolB-like protein
VKPVEWDRVKELFWAALERDPGQRRAFLEAACGTDESLRAEVESLLASHERDDRFIESPLLQVSPEASPDVLPGKRVGAYEVIRAIGHGGMATVYLARDPRHDRNVALKILRPELAAALGPERFLREIRLTAQLQHPQILPLHDSGEADGLLYYVMPYIAGESLRSRLNREPQLPLDEALGIAREVADALSYAHSHDVIHRDIKPENILLSSGHALVADFGIARAITAAGSARLTETGLAIGTPAYMSPEQAAGSQNVDGRSDLYALGCVLYEMLSGEPPYTGPTPQAILAKKLSEPLPRISVVREGVPAGIEAALNKALARTPADRWVTAAEFAAVLAHPEEVVTPVAVPKVRWWRRRAALLSAAAVVVVVAAVAVGRWLRPSASGLRHPRTAIAVLPFENLSAEASQAYFAPGLQDEVLTQLSKVAALTVISRTSVMGYAGTTKPIREIANELAVGTIVEGSVQAVGNRLRVNVQLIDAATAAHVWAEQYDRTLDDAFAVQSEIAQALVGAVGATLTHAEAGAIAAAPTANAQAYLLYLQGEQYRLRPGFEGQNWESAEQLFERALALDSGFALAHASLSIIHGYLYVFAYDPRPERAERERAEAEAALRLAPNLPQAHFAMGMAYAFSHGVARRDLPRTLREYQAAAAALPGSSEVWEEIANVFFQLGEWGAWRSAYERAAELDPRNVDLIFNTEANALWLQHRYKETVAAYNRGLALAPDAAWPKAAKGMLYVVWQGQLDTLRALLAHGPETFSSDPTALNRRVQLALWERKPDAMLALLPAPQRVVFESQEAYEPALLYAAWAYRLRGDSAAAQRTFRGALDQVDSASRGLPDDWRLHASRGLALAGLGRRAEAKQQADWLRATGDSLGTFFGQLRTTPGALILAQAGFTEQALAEIEALLKGPSIYVSVPMLRLDPRWDPIRHDPRFQALLRKYGS